MSTYAWMKILESAPSRYDAGIRMLTLGRLDAAYERLASHVEPGWRVLDVGCGTGALALRAARQGAHVKAIDVNPQMLEVARKRVSEAGLSEKIELCEMGVAELGSEEPGGYDAAIAGLCFSELTEDELNYTLKQTARILKPAGLLLVADEVVPNSAAKRALHRLVRVPVVVITFLLTQTTTRAMRSLPERIQRAGFDVESVRLGGMDSFVELIARKPEAAAP